MDREGVSERPVSTPEASRRSDRAADAETDGLTASLDTIAAGAGAHDRAATFPAEAFDALRRAGVLQAPLPRRCGGQGLGTEPVGATAAAALLRRVGAASLPVGRVLEGHINALHLVVRFGTATAVAQAAAAVRAGHLFGIWVTDGDRPLRECGGRLRGGKAVCSGAGWVTRPLVTALTAADETIMYLPSLEPGPARVGASVRLTGMRAAATAAMDLDGLEAGDPLGGAGDYVREPAFSAGAWRGSAVALGGVDALVAEVITALRGRGRDRDPHQRARIGRLLIAQETARHWVLRAAAAAEAGTLAAGDSVALVGLARVAVEAQGLAAIELAQRALGLAGFREGTTAERLMRDLATYLRQPAPDETLAEAAAWFTTRPVPA